MPKAKSLIRLYRCTVCPESALFVDGFPSFHPLTANNRLCSNQVAPVHWKFRVFKVRMCSNVFCRRDSVNLGLSRKILANSPPDSPAEPNMCALLPANSSHVFISQCIQARYVGRYVVWSVSPLVVLGIKHTDIFLRNGSNRENRWCDFSSDKQWTAALSKTCFYEIVTN